jgi:methyl-accepting chemotaxis protein
MVVENVHRNLKIVEETLEFIEKIKNLGDEIKDDIEEIVKECKQSQKIIQRCLQAELERIYKPADIIRKYWPYPLP